MSRRTVAYAVAIAVIVMLSGAANAQVVRTVGGGGPPNYPTIQAAINASASGDIVQVTAGTYNENIDYSGKLITVESLSGPASTIIDGSPSGGGPGGSVVTMANGESNSAVLRGFTITGGRNSQGGAGIRITNGAAPSIEGNVITANGDPSALGPGGGVFSAPLTGPVSTTTAKFLGNTISNNLATVGGGIYFEFNTPYVVGTSALWNTITANTATLHAGGIFLKNCGTTELQYCAVTANVTGPFSPGGGIYAEGLRLRLIDSKVNDNIAQTDGGGVCLVADAGGSAIMTTEFIGNKAETGSGGAIECQDSSPYIFANTMKLNFADHFGGAIDLNGNCNADIEYNGITRSNRALLRGGGIAIRAASNAAYVASSRLFSNTINFSHAGLEGGGIYCAFVAPTIEDNGLRRNGLPSPVAGTTISSTDSGGGIFVLQDASGGARPIIRHNLLEDGFAEVRGAGIFLNGTSAQVTGNRINLNGERVDAFGASILTLEGGGLYTANGAPEIDGNTILRNQVGDGGFGAGVFIGNPLPGITFTDNVVAKNWLHYGPLSISGAGGGLYVIAPSSARTITFGHNTFADNLVADSDLTPTVFGPGHAIYVDINISAFVHNSIVRGPTGVPSPAGLPLQWSISGTPPIVSYTDIGPTEPVPPWSAGGGNINAPPGFVNPAGDDYHILTTSVCRDIGNRTLRGATEDFDVDGDARPPTAGGAQDDMGADEIP